MISDQVTKIADPSTYAFRIFVRPMKCVKVKSEILRAVFQRSGSKR